MPRKASRKHTRASDRPKKSTSGRSAEWLTEKTIGVFAVPDIDWSYFNNAFQLLYNTSSFLQGPIIHIYKYRDIPGGLSDYFKNDVAIVCAIVDGLITRNPDEILYIDGEGRSVPFTRADLVLDLEPQLVDRLLSYFNIEMRKYGAVDKISAFVDEMKGIDDAISREMRADYQDFVYNEVVKQTSYKIKIDERLYYYVDSLFEVESLSRANRFDIVRAYVSSLRKWLGYSVWFDDLYQQAVKLVTLVANTGGIPPRDYLKRQLETKLLLRILSSSEDERIEYYSDVWEHFDKLYEDAVDSYKRFEVEYLFPLSLDYAGQYPVGFSRRIARILNNIRLDLQHFEDKINNRNAPLYDSLQLPPNTFDDFYRMWREEYSAYMCRPGMSRAHYLPFPDDEKMCEEKTS